MLPGVGRKTANVVLGNAYGINEGITVDTHVTRLSRLLGLTRHDDPVKIEQDLMTLFPQDYWALLSHLLIFHGRSVCIARRPRCDACVLADLCPSARVDGQVYCSSTRLRSRTWAGTPPRFQTGRQGPARKRPGRCSASCCLVLT